MSGKDPGSRKWPSSGASALGTHLGAAVAAQRGPETGAQRTGPPRRRRGAGRPEMPGTRRLALARPPPDAGRVALSRRARPRTDGSSAARRPGQWQSAELAAPRLFVFEPRSPKLQPRGGGEGEGRGREARGGRRPAGASEEPGSGALAPTPPPRAQGAGRDRGEFGRRAQWGDGERKLFN